MMSTRIMKQPSLGSRRHEHDDEEAAEFNLTDWGLKAKISRENTNNSRRFSASYIRSFREDAKSFRSNLTISSTASSPGYNLKEEIDPSTYSFTTALKALQAKTVYSWEYMSPEGLALNSKWDEAEKYICNPLSGEVPMECLSAKTLSGRSFRQLTSRITMSAPLIYPARQAAPPPKPPMPPPLEINQPHTPIPTQEKKIGVTRDVGTQSTPPPYLAGSSSSPSPVPTPSIEERSIKRHASESPSSCAKPKSEEEEEEEDETEELKSGTREEEEVTGRDELEEKAKAKAKEKENSRQGGCLSWRSFLWMRKRQRRREKNRPRKKNNIFLCPIHEC